jgi:hypothetical protein
MIEKDSEKMADKAPSFDRFGKDVAKDCEAFLATIARPTSPNYIKNAEALHDLVEWSEAQKLLTFEPWKVESKTQTVTYKLKKPGSTNKRDNVFWQASSHADPRFYVLVNCGLTEEMLIQLSSQITQISSAGMPFPPKTPTFLFSALRDDVDKRNQVKSLLDTYVANLVSA